MKKSNTGRLPIAYLAALSVFAIGVSAVSVHAEVAQRPEIVDIAAGAELYQDNCAACHGEKLEGQPNWRDKKEDGTLPAPPHDETGHTWHHGDGLLFEITKIGGKAALANRGILDFKSGMPAFEESLSDQEIWNVLSYIRSTWPERVQEMQSGRTDAEKLYGN